MTYFKIIKGKKVVNVGCVFLEWNAERKKFYICDVNNAQFVQTFDEANIYKASWLKPAPSEAGEYETVKVTVIDEIEFEDILAQLNENETVEEEKEPQVILQQPEVIQEPEEEKPMTIAEMRQIIIEQQKQINALLEKIQ